MTASRVRLHINVDHVATLRQARGTPYPDPVMAADLCEQAGADGITVHLREDRRHIQDDDVRRLRGSVRTVLNLEMAASEEMARIALEVGPDMVTLVPEKREERTTEGGLDVVGQAETVASLVARLRSAGMRVNLFIDPEGAQVEASHRTGATGVELHTGDYAHAVGDARAVELDRLRLAGRKATALGLELAAGHGLTVDNTGPLVTALETLEELNIGHAVVADAVALGIGPATRAFIEAIARGREGR